MAMKIQDIKTTTEHQKIAKEHCILLIRSGSALYGTKTENSDDDALGVFVEPEEYKFGRKHIETVEFKTNASDSGKRNQKGDLDLTLHSLDKFIGLAQNNNPTICELFFPPQNCILHLDECGQELLDAYPLFISKKLYHSHCGYAYSQINRNEVKSGNQSGRKDIIDKFGYDCKLMSHAIRLYMEAIELLGTGRLEFPLKENQKLLDIKKGLWTYEKCQEECKKLETLAGQVYASSQIRHSPDQESIHKLQIKLYKKYLGYNN
jgi:predicted nucleotidyltransferase